MPTPRPNGPQRLPAEHLPNAIQLHAKVISGGLPQGDGAFQELQALGVKTVISVDGAKPDVETAARFGLRYVHLPHGYNGIPDNRVKELAKAVRDLDGRIYIHCHHGKHRSPAAASVACVSAGMLSPRVGLAVLKWAGTSSDYRGLHDSVRDAQPLGKALLDGLDVDFRETVEVPPMAEAMVEIERIHDQLKLLAAADWRTPADHPDLESAHEALMLREQFTELLRADYVQKESGEFQQLLRDSEQAAEALEGTLRASQRHVLERNPPGLLVDLANRINANCKKCHRRFRDMVPSEE